MNAEITIEELKDLADNIKLYESINPRFVIRMWIKYGPNWPILVINTDDDSQFAMVLRSNKLYQLRYEHYFDCKYKFHLWSALNTKDDCQFLRDLIHVRQGDVFDFIDNEAENPGAEYMAYFERLNEKYVKMGLPRIEIDEK